MVFLHSDKVKVAIDPKDLQFLLPPEYNKEEEESQALMPSAPTSVIIPEALKPSKQETPVTQTKRPYGDKVSPENIVNIRDVKKDTPEWEALKVAKEDPVEYFKSKHFRFPLDRKFDLVTNWLLGDLLKKDPSFYFDHNIYRIEPIVFGPWRETFYKALLDENPRKAISVSLKHPILQEFNPQVWEKFVNESKDLTTDRIFNPLLSLAWNISKSHPDFFISNVMDVIKGIIDKRKEAGKESPQTIGNYYHMLRKSISDAKQILDRRAFILIIPDLMKIANSLDQTGELEIASEIDELIKSVIISKEI